MPWDVWTSIHTDIMRLNNWCFVFFKIQCVIMVEANVACAPQPSALSVEGEHLVLLKLVQQHVSFDSQLFNDRNEKWINKWIVCATKLNQITWSTHADWLRRCLMTLLTCWSLLLRLHYNDETHWSLRAPVLPHEPPCKNTHTHTRSVRYLTISGWENEKSFKAPDIRWKYQLVPSLRIPKTAFINGSEQTLKTMPVSAGLTTVTNPHTSQSILN